MAGADIFLPLNTLDRRRNSETNHIIRIRTAYAGRQFLPWGKDSFFHAKKSFPLISESNEGRKRLSLDSELARKYKITSSQDYNETVRSIKDMQVSGSEIDRILENEKKMKFKKSISTHSETKASKPVTSHSVRNLKKETQEKQKKSVSKTSSTTIDKKFTTVQKAKTSKSRGSKRSRNIKKYPKSIKQANVSPVQQSKSTDKDLIKLAEWLQENIETLDRPITSKDLVVLKWLQGLKIPEEGNDRETNYKESKAYPIQILKGYVKPISPLLMLNMPMESRYKDIRKKSKTSSLSNKMPAEKKKSGRLSGDNSEMEDTYNDKEKDEQSTFPESDGSQYPEFSSKNIGQENTYLGKGIRDEFESKDQTASFGKKDESRHDAEMLITELGKLQIVLNLKSFQSDDVAVIIWLNEIPKTQMKPDYRKRLSITSLPDRQPPEKPTIFKSTSSVELEDIASPKPQIHFPPVTVLKNLAVDSKGELRNLKETSSSVFYKRCNLIHVDSEHSLSQS